MRWFRFILSHSIFIAVCALGLCYQTFTLLQIQPNTNSYLFVFFATLCSYNFYWLVSNLHFKTGTGIFIGLKKMPSHVSLFLIAGSGTLVCLYKQPSLLPMAGLSVFFTLLYSLPLWPIRQPALLQKAGFLKTLLLAFTWTFVTVMIPVQGQTSLHTYAILLLFLARFCFMLMLCIIFDSRDVTSDRVRSFHSLATDADPRILSVIIAIAFLFYTGIGLMLRSFFSDNRQVVAFMLTGLITLVVYQLSKKERGYYFYYFVVDGLMLISALATFIATI
jgi:hypothetical protein